MKILTRDKLGNKLDLLADGLVDLVNTTDILRSHEALRGQSEHRLELLRDAWLYVPAGVLFEAIRTEVEAADAQP